MINVLMAENHIVRYGLRILLESNDKFHIAAEVSNGHAALEVLSEDSDIDIVLIDLTLPSVNGIELAEKLDAMGSRAKVIILSDYNDQKYISRAFKAGARGYLLKAVTPEELVYAIQHVFAGGQYLCSLLAVQYIGNAVDDVKNVHLNSREIEVLGLIASGKTNQAIADKVFLSKRTVEGHRQNLLDKFKVQNTAHLVYTAMKSGLIQ